MMNIYKKFSKNVGLLGLARASTQLQGIFLLPVLTKILGESPYGLWVQASVMITLLMWFVDLGLPYSMVRHLASEEEESGIRDGFYSILLILLASSLLASGMIYLFSDQLASLLFDGANWVVLFVAILVPLRVVNRVYISFFRTFREMKKYSVIEIFTQYGWVFLAIVFVLWGYGLQEVFLSYLVIFALVTFSLVIYLWTRIGFVIPTFSNIREYLRFGLPTIPGNMSSWVTSSSDRFLISFYLGILFVGYYNPAYKIGTAPFMLTSILGFILPATLSDLYDSGKIKQVKKFLKFTLKYLLLLTIPFLFGASLMAEQFLRILSTAEIASQGIIIVPVVAVAALFFVVYLPFMQIIVLKKKTEITGAIWILSAVTNIFLNIVLIPRIGILGAGITTLISYGIAMALTIYYARKELTFQIEKGPILKSLLGSSVMSLLIFFWNPFGILSVIICVFTSISIYFLVLYLLRTFSDKELRLFKNIIIDYFQ